MATTVKASITEYRNVVEDSEVLRLANRLRGPNASQRTLIFGVTATGKPIPNFVSKL